MCSMSGFQVKLSGSWQNYEQSEDKILKRAYMSGFPNAKYEHRGQKYLYDFKRMVQTNAASGKERQIRAPHKWSQPAKPMVPEGPTTVITVPSGAPGTTIEVPHPQAKGSGETISVAVPRTARPGQAMLVPVPPLTAPGRASVADIPASAGRGDDDAKVAASSSPKDLKPKPGMSTGAKVATGIAGTAVVAGAVLGGVYVAEHGLDATVDAVGDGLADAGEAIADWAVDAGEFVVDGAEDIGDFIMDLF